jgi:hypothetical protein
MTNSAPEPTVMTGHQLLLRLAGRVPDQALARARRTLADGGVSRAMAQLTNTFAQTPFPLTAQELVAIRSLAGECEALSGVHPAEELPALPFDFVDLDEYGGAGRDELDEALVAAVEAHSPEITGVWRSWRYSRLHNRRPTYYDPPYRVYVIEVEHPGMIPGLSADLLRAVPESAEAGVEIIPLSDEPFPYQDEALAESLLLWARDEPYLVADRFADVKTAPAPRPITRDHS